MSARLATLASLRRLNAVAAKRAGTLQSSVMEVPAFVSLDEWQRAAVASQAALMAATREGVEDAPRVVSAQLGSS